MPGCWNSAGCFAISKCLWAGTITKKSLYRHSIYFSTQIKNGNPINIFEDGKESRDFIFIDDTVNATILGLEKDEANGEVFNVGTGEATSVRTVATELIENFDKKVPLEVTGDYRVGDIRHNYADITKIKKMLGFKPKVTFENGIQRFSGWVDRQQVEKDLSQNSVNEMKEKGLMK